MAKRAGRAAVYALMNWRAGLIYVGSSMDVEKRFAVWRSRLRCIEVEVLPEQVWKRFYEASKGLPASDWECVVIESFDATVDRSVVKAAEYRYLGCIERLWWRCMLNTGTTADFEVERMGQRVGGVPYVRGTRYRVEDGYQEPARFGLRGRLTARDRRVLHWLDAWCRFPRARPARGNFRPRRTPRVKRVLRWLAAWCRF